MKSIRMGTLALMLCASAFAADIISMPLPSVQKTTAYVLLPQIGKVARAEVGESLYSEYANTQSKELIGSVKESVVVQMENYRLSVTAGSIRPILTRTGSQSSMMCFPVKRTGVGVIWGNKGYLGCLVDTKGDQTFDTATFAHRTGDFPLEKPVPYSVETQEITEVAQDKFQIEILYQGMSKGEVKISYREFYKGIARPAFTQDVTYELSSDGTAVVGFKGMRLKVLKATGQSIEYVLEQPIPSFTKIRADLQDERNAKSQKPWYQ